MDTLDAERRRRFLAFFESRYRGDRASLIKDAGLTKGRVSQLFDANAPFGQRAASNLAEKLGLQPDAFERTAADPPLGGVAQSLILDKFTVPATATLVELRDMEVIPASFRLEAPDDSLAPKITRGMPLIMAAGTAAKPDQVVLVKDKGGDLHLRRYGQGIGGNWRARATNDAYITLEAERDGLTLLAVLKWVDGEGY